MAAFASAGKSMPGAHVDEETERRDLLAELDAWSRDDITTRPPAASLYDQDLYDLNHSFSIDGHGDDEGELSHHQSSMLHYPHHDHIEALNEGSLNDVSFADSEPWDEYDQGPAPIMAQQRLDLSSNVHSLFELETEVKHYKQETLKLQKRREALEADQRKLDQQRHDWHEEKRKAQEDMDAQWKHLRKERRALDQALKFGAATPDRKERGEIDALKAQLVKMQVRTR
ncbi:hypothetical protein DYB26_002437 [Aphanomyces astaci]|uniref:Uncharacterized protein n=1 Tax=Aphanomyces astaci TaxID=112090 RepID=A0A3R6YJ08_APHAT|nr:hypothetical protein DYB26_002437 [Aphanomyces astaci]